MVAEVLARIRSQSDALVSLIRPLSADLWDGPTNCPPWRVRDLAKHVVSSGEGFIASIQNGLAGSVTPPTPHAAPESASPSEVADGLTSVTDRFIALYDGLTDDLLEVVCWHRRGNRSVRWYAAHRLAEVAFHGWDLRTSLGQQAVFDDDVAALLLPTLLESNAPRTYAAGLSAERGSGERYLLSVTGQPLLTWCVTVTPDVLLVARGESAADVRISAPAADLALLVYGRANLAAPAFVVSGDRAIAERFARVFPRP